MTRKKTTLLTLHNKKAAPGALIVIATAYRCQSALATDRGAHGDQPLEPYGYGFTVHRNGAERRRFVHRRLMR